MARNRSGTAVLLVVLAVALSGCQTQPSAAPPMDAAAAVAAARTFVVQGQPSGTTFVELTNSPPVRNGGAWRVAVDARIVYPQETQELAIHYLLDVSAVTGEVSIVGQG